MEWGSLAAVLFCVRWDSKFDQQIAKLFTYYSQVFGELMRTNLIVVLTRFGESIDAIELRKDEGKDLETIRRQFSWEVHAIVGDPSDRSNRQLSSLIEERTSTVEATGALNDGGICEAFRLVFCDWQSCLHCKEDSRDPTAGRMIEDIVA